MKIPLERRDWSMVVIRHVICCLFTAAFCLTAWSCAVALTCDECLKMEKEMRANSQELSEQTKELRAAFSRAKYAEIKKIRERINILRGALNRIRKAQPECAKACSPESRQRQKCWEIKLEIKKLESKPGGGKAGTAKVDKLYGELVRCNRDLKKILRVSE